MEPSYVKLPIDIEEPFPDEFNGDDVRYHPDLVRYFIGRYTKPGDFVFDPFAGYGTTLVVAEQMGRDVGGVELMSDRADYIEKQLKNTEYLLNGDILRINLDKLPKINFCMTSPPYMGKEDKADGLTGYQFAGKYKIYLEKLQQVYRKLQSNLQNNATIILEVSNLKQQNSVTTLAWDIGKLIGEIYKFEGEVIICWEGEENDDGIYGYGYDHSYCLIFTNF